MFEMISLVCLITDHFNLHVHEPGLAPVSGKASGRWISAGRVVVGDAKGKDKHREGGHFDNVCLLR